MIQKMNSLPIAIILSLSVMGVFAPAGAADFDGSAPLFCAFSKAEECQPKSACEQVLPEEVGLPTFFRIDFKNKLISATQEGKTRTTEIKSLYQADGKLILQGYEARSWSLVIGAETGRMALAVAGEDDGFVLFGTCMVP